MKKPILIAFVISFIALTLKAQNAKLVIPSGHIYGIADASFSDDDKYILTVAENVKIWETASGKLVKNINPLGKPSEAMMLKNNKFIVIACEDSIRIWDVYNDKQVKAFAGNSFQLNEKMNALIIMSINDNDPALTKKAKLYDASTYVLKHEFENPIAYVSDENQYISVDFDIVNVYDNSFKKVFSSKEGNISGVSSDYRYLSIIKDKAIKIWDTRSKKLLHTLMVNELYHYTLKFVPESNLFIVQTTPQSAKNGYVTQEDDSFIRGYDLSTFKEIYKFAEQRGNIQELKIYKGKVTVASNDSTIRQWDAKTGKLISQVKDPYGYSAHITMDETGRYILASSNKETAKIWDMQSKNVKLSLEKNNSYVSHLRFLGTADLAFFEREGDAWIWDIKKAEPKFSVPTKKGRYNTYVSVNNAGTFLYVISQAKTQHQNVKGGGFTLDFKMKDCTLEIYDLTKNVLVNKYSLSEDFWRFAPSYDGQHILISNRDDSFQQLNISSGFKSSPLKSIKDLRAVRYYLNDDFVAITDSTFSLYSKDLNLLSKVSVPGEISSYNYDQQMGLAVFVLSDQRIVAKDVKTNQVLFEISSFRKNTNKAFDDEFTDIVFDQDKKYLAISGVAEANVLVIDLKTGKTNKSIRIPTYSAKISFNKKNNLLVETNNGYLYEWSIEQEKMLDQSRYQTDDIDALQGSEKYLLGHSGAEVHVFDKRYKDPMYTISVLPGEDYIVYDQDKRFDGTEIARKRLYLTCGMELIDLEQVKDQLWVPGLAKRIMLDDNINAVKIADLEICGLTPRVEKIEQKGGYRFRIIPQKGGLGETVLYLNDIELRRYKPQQLLKTAQGYELSLSDADLIGYLKTGQENRIDVKAYTIKNDISSRGVSVSNITKPASPERPNLFAVMIGVSDYKGNELDLQYAAKDASDVAKAVAISARKLLNTDGKEHVFMYKLTTDSGRYLLPEKKAIQQTLATIGQKAKPNDILMIFFAGHGVTQGTQKQFYLLSAEASSTSMGSMANVGISTAELTDWIQPSKIKAQKRILILDACNSGQAIKDLVQIGGGQQNYIAARSDDHAEQVKAIDKLNERAGLFVLAASASDQRAYEMGRFNQGLLTYALLKAIKEQPDILDQGKYLDVGRWFGSAEKTVTEIVRETGNRQQPQVVSTSNFNIGIVDGEVMTAIKLPSEKAMFIASSLINMDAGDDDLSLTQLVNKHLSIISTRGEEGNIVYTLATNQQDAFMLTGVYSVSGDEVLIKLNLKKGSVIQTRFEVKGNKNNLEKTAGDAIKLASEWISKNKP